MSSISIASIAFDLLSISERFIFGIGTMFLSTFIFSLSVIKNFSDKIGIDLFSSLFSLFFSSFFVIC